MAPMKTSWNYQDIVDFEYFCHLDKNADETELHRRDRDIFLSHQEQVANTTVATRSDLLRFWVAARVTEDFPGPEQKSPGALLVDALRLAKSLVVIKGLIVGLVAGISFFTYSGTTPVNVFHFLLFFVASQLALASLVLIACLLRIFVPQVRVPSFYFCSFTDYCAGLPPFSISHSCRVSMPTSELVSPMPWTFSGPAARFTDPFFIGRCSV